MTPRTDNMFQRMELCAGGLMSHPLNEGWREFCASLETELAEAKAEIANIKGTLLLTQRLAKSAGDYILNQAPRHDLNWLVGHSIIDAIDAATKEPE